jgi:hypothetical protein
MNYFNGRQSLLRNKKIISKNTMLIFPDFHKVFEIHKETPDYQLGFWPLAKTITY